MFCVRVRLEYRVQDFVADCGNGRVRRQLDIAAPGCTMNLVEDASGIAKRFPARVDPYRGIGLEPCECLKHKQFLFGESE